MRTLLIGDVHANLPALLALPAADRILCTGDLVGYGPHPGDVLEFLQDARATCVRGDEDDAVGNGTEHVLPPGFEHACREMRDWTRRTLAPAELGALRALPPEWEEEIDGIRIATIHAYPGDYERYIEPNREQLNRISRAFPRARLIVLGHTHRPGLWSWGETLIVNPGSVGQPQRPGYASFAVLENGAVHFSAVRFDVLETLRGVAQVPLSGAARTEIELGLIRGGARPYDRVSRSAVVGG